MICPHCGHNDNRVIDTRIHKEGDIRRRRECLSCKGRFTTVETILRQYPHVTKRDGVREPFNQEKLKRGLQLACLKRPVSLAQVEGMVDRLSREVLSHNEKEISSIDLGTLVMRELKGLDDVAYVRFASVYRNFRDVQEFVQSLESEAKPEDSAGK